MRMIFKQRMFSWFDSYDIYDEFGKTLYKVKGKLSLGHQLRIYDNNDNEIGMIQEKFLSLLPEFKMYVDGTEIGSIYKELTFFTPEFSLSCNDWKVIGDVFGWDYEVVDSNNIPIMIASKQLFSLTDTYEIEVKNRKNALYSLMIVLAIDAAKCSKQ